MKQSEQLIVDDLTRVIEHSEADLKQFADKTAVVTGATGLIGSLLVKLLLLSNKQLKIGARVIAVVRDDEKVMEIFQDQYLSDDLHFLYADVRQQIHLDEPIDYIFHAASCTQSSQFVTTPVDVFNTTVLGTKNLLALAKAKQVQAFVYLSTMEIYGVTERLSPIAENEYAPIDPLQVRNSYPTGKLAAEALCFAYFKQFNLPIRIARPTLTFGPGIGSDDNRVFAQFARGILNDGIIRLATKGKSCRDYLYTADALTALITIAINGQAGEAYNISNPDTYVSIKEMAGFVIKHFGGSTSHVVHQNDDAQSAGYAQHIEIKLDTDKLRQLGWEPKYNLKQMYERLIAYIDATSDAPRT